MRAALFGVMGSGRKSLMECLRTGVDAGGIPVGKKTVVTVNVPDARIDKLSAMYKPKKTTYATIEMTLDDKPSESLAGMLLGVRNYDVLVLISAAYDKEDLARESILSELDNVVQEMILSDLMVVEKRIKHFKQVGDKGQEATLFARFLEQLEGNGLLRDVELDEGELNLLSAYSFLTRKTLIQVINIAEEELGTPLWEEVAQEIRGRGVEPVILCASLEKELATLSPEEQQGFLEELGLGEPASHRMVQSVYRALNLVSFFTVGEDEVRAWPVQAASSAPVAGGKIHSDIQRGFIRAEVVGYDDFIKAGSMAACKRSGTFRAEGKGYTVKDGDIINFLFNV